jgi:hypothetical protein
MDVDDIPEVGPAAFRNWDVDLDGPAGPVGGPRVLGMIVDPVSEDRRFHPVGWEAEAEDEVERLLRRLESRRDDRQDARRAQALRLYYLHAGCASSARGVARAMGTTESAVWHLLAEGLEGLRGAAGVERRRERGGRRHDRARDTG